MSVLIGIPTYEREPLVRHCLATAAELELPPGSEIVVFDDASPTLDVEALMREAGLPAHFRRGAVRRGPSHTSCEIWRHFLAGDHRHLLILDSDMIANRSAVMDGLRLRDGFDGLVSLYNSRNHPGIADGDDRVSKRKVGNAGTLWTRPLAEMVLAEFGDEPGVVNVDDAYSDLFASRAIPIVAFRRSRVQHLGIVGTNNRYFGNFEHGLGFRPDSEPQMRALLAVYDELMSRQEDYVAPPRQRRSLASKLWRRLVR
ncbi:MAG: glycosyltransferase family 2 protein [Mesorhizobium sp.]